MQGTETVALAQMLSACDTISRTKAGHDLSVILIHKRARFFFLDYSSSFFQYTTLFTSPGCHRY